MNEKLKEKVKESLSSVLPITLIVLVLSVTLVPMEIGTLALFLTGAVLLIVGMGFFQLGAEMSMTPLGEGVGVRGGRAAARGEQQVAHAVGGDEVGGEVAGELAGAAGDQDGAGGE